MVPGKRGRPASPDLQQRRRDGILDAATALFSRHGYHGADLQDLADQLGVGKGTVYRYFPSKRELFLAAADRVMRLLHEHVETARRQRQDPMEQVEVAITAYLADLGRGGDHVRTVFGLSSWWGMKLCSARWLDFARASPGLEVPKDLAGVVAAVADRLAPILEGLP